jgi:hypothetical protein
MEPMPQQSPATITGLADYDGASGKYKLQPDIQIR